MSINSLVTRPRVTVGEYGIQMWAIAVIICSKQTRTADKGWSYNLDDGRES
jgi:hypothetical protein